MSPPSGQLRTRLDEQRWSQRVIAGHKAVKGTSRRDLSSFDGPLRQAFANFSPYSLIATVTNPARNSDRTSCPQ